MCFQSTDSNWKIGIEITFQTCIPDLNLGRVTTGSVLMLSKFLLISLSLSRWMLEKYLETGHDCLLPHHFLCYYIFSSSSHLILCCLESRSDVWHIAIHNKQDFLLLLDLRRKRKIKSVYYKCWQNVLVRQILFFHISVIALLLMHLIQWPMIFPISS
jgi:hypothetical protein